MQDGQRQEKNINKKMPKEISKQAVQKKLILFLPRPKDSFEGKLVFLL
jgi:hypothetical protein